MSEQFCIFCKTVSGEIPKQIVYSDELIEAIMDIAPMNPGHVLVMPKQHVELFMELQQELMNAVMAGVQRVAAAQMQGLGVDGFSLKVNNGKVAGQLVPHVHIHVIPRYPTDTLVHWPGGRYKEGEMEALAEKIRSAMEQ